jgi:hypothetical protein
MKGILLFGGEDSMGVGKREMKPGSAKGNELEYRDAEPMRLFSCCGDGVQF